MPVAKHGNRAASSHCGSADLLEALGVQDRSRRAPASSAASPTAGIGFMFAPVFHPAFGHAAPVRGELRVPTSFNFLGPLTNPARPTAQVVGVSDERMLPLMAEVLARRGTRAKLFRGEDGLDELTTTGPSLVLDVRDGKVREEPSRSRRSTGSRGRRGTTCGGATPASRRASPARCSAASRVPTRDVVLLNAGAALEVAGVAPDLDGGIALRGILDRRREGRRRRSTDGSRFPSPPRRAVDDHDGRRRGGRALAELARSGRGRSGSGAPVLRRGDRSRGDRRRRPLGAVRHGRTADLRTVAARPRAGRSTTERGSSPASRSATSSVHGNG